MDCSDTCTALLIDSSPRTPRRSPGRRASLALATAAATLLTGGIVVGMAPGAQATGSDNAAFLSHLNSLRAAHGLHALSVSSDLASIATAHSAAMMVKQTIFHNASLTSEVSNWQVLGENVGMGGSAAAIDTAFDNSPEHYANEISSAYTQVGIGTARDTRGYLYVTLDFRKPQASAPAPRPPAPKPAPKPVVKAPVVHAPAVHVPVARPPAARPPSSTPHTVTRQATTPTSSAPVTARAVAPTTPQSHASATAAAVATAAARQAPTVVPDTATGNDPVASALAFSRLLAGMR